jgi:hypothetical protein
MGITGDIEISPALKIKSRLPRDGAAHAGCAMCTKPRMAPEVGETGVAGRKGIALSTPGGRRGKQAAAGRRETGA